MSETSKQAVPEHLPPPEEATPPTPAATPEAEEPLPAPPEPAASPELAASPEPATPAATVTPPPSAPAAPPLPTDAAVRADSHKHTRRSFAVAAVASAAGYGLYRWIDRAQQVNRLQVPLRHVLDFNREVARTVFDERGLAPEFARSRASDLRLNGTVGLEKHLDPASWRLQLAGSQNASTHPRYTADLTTYNYRYLGDLANTSQSEDVKSAPGNGTASKTGAPTPKQPTLADRFDAMNQKLNHKRVRGNAEAGASASGLTDGTPGLLLTMEDLLRLPKVELVTEFKCVEGWSQIVHWAGVRLRDFIDAYPPAPINGQDPKYVYMETPDGDFYGGYDMAAARHPQSILVTEMGGLPLDQQHGAPLRLHMPIKYGYKQIKRIGLIAYMPTRPDDYWTKLGYDWYAGL